MSIFHRLDEKVELVAKRLAHLGWDEIPWDDHTEAWHTAWRTMASDLLKTLEDNGYCITYGRPFSRYTHYRVGAIIFSNEEEAKETGDGHVEQQTITCIESPWKEQRQDV